MNTPTCSLPVGSLPSQPPTPPSPSELATILTSSPIDLLCLKYIISDENLLYKYE